MIDTTTRLAGVLTLMTTIACTSTPSTNPPASTMAIARPTGSARDAVTPPRGPTDSKQRCTAPDDGSRQGFHSAAGTTWLVDCENPLKREYWRVFENTPRKTAYTMPRLDGALELGEACKAVDHELHSIVTRYRLCKAADADATVSVINAMDPRHAFTLTRYLHGQLRFVKNGNSISPYPIPSDVRDACTLRADERSKALARSCQEHAAWLASGEEVAADFFSGKSVDELVERLNELYGIG